MEQITKRKQQQAQQRRFKIIYLNHKFISRNTETLRNLQIAQENVIAKSFSIFLELCLYLRWLL